MREILFRGKTEKGEWVYGDLLHPDNCGNGYSIEDFTKYKNNCFDVIPETVGQYTGLTDKNGKRIFEGDIVKGTFYGYPMPFENYVFVIGWQEDVAGYKANYFENVEVIGNIHDNNELIGGKDDE